MLETPPTEHLTNDSATPPHLFDPRTGEPLARFDPQTGEPLGRFDPQTGKPLHTPHTSFFPSMPAWGYLTIHGAWALFNVMMILITSSMSAADWDGTVPSTGMLIGVGVMFWVIGATIIAAANFGIRKVRHLP